MGSEDGQYIVEAWVHGGVLLETYVYPPGPAGSLPEHWHDEYQLGLSLDFPGEYHYRGENHTVPPGALTVIHPGEVHYPRDPIDRRSPAHYWMIYADPSVLGKSAAEVAGHERGLSSFPNSVIVDEHLARSFLGTHLALEGPVSRLEKDSRILFLLSDFVVSHTSEHLEPRSVGKEHEAVRLAKERLGDAPGENVSLEELSRVVNLSPYHLSRVFKEEVGMPPHAYQMNVRLARAKDLLLKGWPISKIAQEAGFYDQSHFTRYFKRLVGVTPGHYAKNSKIFQY